MGAQWKHAGRIGNASKRSALIGKLIKEIMVAARIGDPNPVNNPRLRAAIEAAKKNSVPRETIDRALKKASGVLSAEDTYEMVTYEGFAPYQVPVIVECLTNNKNRTAAEIRVLFRKGQLGSIGSVSWMFDRLGVVEATYPEAGIDIERVAIEVGAQNVEPLEAEEVSANQTGARFFTDMADLDTVTKALTAASWTVTLSEFNYIAKNKLELKDDQKKEVADFLNAIDDNDDVHRIYTAL
jgi:YebC/PmpR family DNA-binding regulatory protein